MTPTTIRIGVYVDSVNIAMNGGRGMRYDSLREFACRDGGEAMRLNAYIVHDSERAREDVEYRYRQLRFEAALVDYGYKAIRKEVRWFQDEQGGRVGKANADLDLAVDALLLSAKLDRILLVSGVGDFGRVVGAIQNLGCRVEVLAFRNVSGELRREADMYVSGYVVPGLLPCGGGDISIPWGDVGSRVRGYCYTHHEGYGFLRVMKSATGPLWITDTRRDDSPFVSVFFHDSQLPRDVSYRQLPSRNIVFEFTLAPGEGEHEGLQAADMVVVGGE